MDVTEIVNRESASEYATKELTYVVEQYIKEKKGVDVEINPFKHAKNSPFGGVIVQIAMQQLNHAYDVAAAYFLDKQKNKRNDES